MPKKYLLPGDEVIETGDILTLSEIIDWGIVDIEVPKLWNKNKGDINNLFCVGVKKESVSLYSDK